MPWQSVRLQSCRHRGEIRQTIIIHLSWLLFICREARPSVSAWSPQSASAPLCSSSSVLACSPPGLPRPSRWWVQSVWGRRKLPIWDLLWLVWSKFDRQYNEHISKNCLTSIAACANDHKSRPKGQYQPIAGLDLDPIWPMRSLSWWKITGTWFHKTSGLYLVFMLIWKMFYCWCSECFHHAAKRCISRHWLESVVFLASLIQYSKELWL